MWLVHPLAFLFIQCDNTVEINFFRKINLLGYSGHLDEKNDAWTIFSDILYLIWMIYPGRAEIIRMRLICKNVRKTPSF